jgi:hypothetical protein
LPEIGQALRRPPSFPGLRQHGQQHGRQNGDDGNDHQQFNQGKPPAPHAAANKNDPLYFVKYIVIKQQTGRQ